MVTTPLPLWEGQGGGSAYLPVPYYNPAREGGGGATEEVIGGRGGGGVGGLDGEDAVRVGAFVAECLLGVAGGTHVEGQAIGAGWQVGP